MEELQISQFFLYQKEGNHRLPDRLVVQCRLPVSRCLPWPTRYETRGQRSLPVGEWDDSGRYSHSLAEPMRVVLPEGCRGLKVKLRQGSNTVATFKVLMGGTCCTSTHSSIGVLLYRVRLQEPGGKADGDHATLGGQCVDNDATLAGQSVDHDVSCDGKCDENYDHDTFGVQGDNGDDTFGDKCDDDDDTLEGKCDDDDDDTFGGKCDNSNDTLDGKCDEDRDGRARYNAFEEEEERELKAVVSWAEEVDEAEARGLDVFAPQSTCVPPTAFVHCGIRASTENEATAAVGSNTKKSACQKRRARRRALATALKAAAEREAAAKLESRALEESKTSATRRRRARRKALAARIRSEARLAATSQEPTPRDTTPVTTCQEAAN